MIRLGLSTCRNYNFALYRAGINSEFTIFLIVVIIFTRNKLYATGSNRCKLRIDIACFSLKICRKVVSIIDLIRTEVFHMVKVSSDFTVNRYISMKRCISLLSEVIDYSLGSIILRRDTICICKVFIMRCDKSAGRKIILKNLINIIIFESGIRPIVL